MPTRFQGCDASTGKRLVACCLNSAAVPAGRKHNLPGCTPCRRCQFVLRAGRQCGNTTCLDDRYCWTHVQKVYGVAVRDSQHGKGLVATRAFAAGEFVAPLGGRAVTRRALKNLRGRRQTITNWEDLASTEPNTAVYGYPVTVPATPRETVYRRGERGYVAGLPPARRRAVQWRGSPATPRDRELMTAVVAGRGAARREYLVHRDEYAAFVADLRARTRGDDEDEWWRQASLSKFDPEAFEAYVVVPRTERVTMDASCARAAGSYANDPAVVDVGAGRVEDAREDAANAVIEYHTATPLAPTGWLRAVKPIRAGQRILVSYGERYWQGAGAVKYGTVAVGATRDGARRARKVYQVGARCTV